jgi:hypothetical protein
MSLRAPFVGRTLKGMKWCYKDLCQEQQSRFPDTFLIVPTKNLHGNELAEVRTREIDRLMMLLELLLPEKLHAVD